jgi:malonyl-CoA O-methyltransferase
MQHNPPKRLIARSFGLKAHKYDQNASVQSMLLDRCAMLIKCHADNQGAWIDLGSGTAALADKLAAVAPGITLVCMDIAWGAAVAAKPASRNLCYIVADIDNPPFRNCQFSGIIISSVTQWLPDPQHSFTCIQKMLRSDGMLIFSIFSAEAFKELRMVQSHFGIKNTGFYPTVPEIEHMLHQAGFEIIECADNSIVKYHASAHEALKEISSIGATARTGRNLTKKELGEFYAAYEHEFRNASGVPVHYSAILGAARRRS